MIVLGINTVIAQAHVEAPAFMRFDKLDGLLGHIKQHEVPLADKCALIECFEKIGVRMGACFVPVGWSIDQVSEFWRKRLPDPNIGSVLNVQLASYSIIDQYKFASVLRQMNVDIVSYPTDQTFYMTYPVDDEEAPK